MRLTSSVFTSSFTIKMRWPWDFIFIQLHLHHVSYIHGVSSKWHSPSLSMIFTGSPSILIYSKISSWSSRSSPFSNYKKCRSPIMKSAQHSFESSGVLPSLYIRIGLISTTEGFWTTSSRLVTFVLLRKLPKSLPRLIIGITNNSDYWLLVLRFLPQHLLF